MLEIILIRAISKWHRLERELPVTGGMQAEINGHLVRMLGKEVKGNEVI